MSSSRVRLITAAGFFLFWLAAFYAGADHPPPSGFLLVVLFDLLAAAGMYHRVAAYAAWSRARRPGRLWRVLAEGVVAGLFLGLLALALPGGGDPSTPPPLWYDYLIWFVVLAIAGIINALAIYAIAAALSRRTLK